jgi:outer membrane protein assembly factor BamB
MDGGLYAVDSNGSFRWRFATKFGGISTSPAIGSDGTIYVGEQYAGRDSGNSRLYAVGPSGAAKWYIEVAGAMCWSSPAVASDGTVYIGTNGGLYAISKSGKLVWQLDLLNHNFGPPAVGRDGTVYVGVSRQTSGAILALTPSGGIKWQFETNRGAARAIAIDLDGTIYIGEEFTVRHPLAASTFYALRPSGALKWKFVIPSERDNQIFADPAIDRNGRLYVGTDGLSDYVLYAFE